MEWGKMTANAEFGKAKLESIGIGLMLRIKRMAGHKHRDLILALSVSLGFVMLIIFSTAS
jgi:hypothetical protein